MVNRIIIALIILVSLLAVGTALASIGYIETNKDAAATPATPEGTHQYARTYDSVVANLLCDKQDFFMVSLDRGVQVDSVELTIENRQ